MSHPSSRTYLYVFLALLVLTVITVAVSYVALPGPGNVIVGLLIASLKACLVALFFMHLKYEGPFIRRTVLVPLALLLILVVGMVLDIVVYLPRHDRILPH